MAYRAIIEVERPSVHHEAMRCGPCGNKPCDWELRIGTEQMVSLTVICDGCKDELMEKLREAE